MTRAEIDSLKVDDWIVDARETRRQFWIVLKVDQRLIGKLVFCGKSVGVGFVNIGFHESELLSDDFELAFSYGKGDNENE